MPKRSRKPPRDENQAAKAVIDAIAKLSGETDGKDPLAVALGRRGGLKGGLARRAALTPEQRKESARKAAEARWGKSNQGKS
jgi:hypothetical protein